MFALPWVALSRVGGWLADHANRRAIALIGLFNGAFFLALYPHIHNNVALVGLGSLEAVATSMAMPSVSSLLTQGADDRELSRRQGLSSTANTASLALAASASGVLFTRDPALPFTIVAIVSAALASTTLWWWRQVRGHISR
jgi:MFS family permease